MTVILVPGLSPAMSLALESLFHQELPGEGPCPIGRKLGNALVEKGYAIPAKFVLGHGPFAVTIQSFRITWAGHLAYCAACGDADLDEVE